jgi:tetratricopeptide (TPR) repeat protein
MSIPNVRHFNVVGGLLDGRWKYEDEGLLDRTHLRFFTLAEIKEMLDDAGMDTIAIQGKRVDDIYQEGMSGALNLGGKRIENISKEEMPEFFFFQYLVVATPKRPANEGEDDPSHPNFFRKLVSAQAHGGPLDDSKIYEIANAVAADNPVMFGHCSMALGMFEQAEDIYRKAGAVKYEGCALAARGLALEALKKWAAARPDKDAEEWFLRFRHGDGAPENIALNAISPAPASLGQKAQTGISTSAICRVENEDDPIGALTALRNALPPSGVLAVYFLTGEAENVYPAPHHIFSADGMRRLLNLVGGFGEPTVIELLPGMSGLAVCQKDVKTPSVDFEAVIKKRFARIACKKALYYWEQKMFEAAAQSARAAISLDGDNPDALSKLGDCHLIQNDLAGAEKLYAKGTASEDSPAPLIGMGTLNLIKGDFQAAKVFFEKAVSKVPENGDALSGLGLALVSLGQSDKGVELCKKAVVLMPESFETVGVLARAYCVVGDHAAAENALGGYLELHPANLDALLTLADVRISGGKRDEAREALERILMFNPNHKQAAALLSAINGK